MKDIIFEAELINEEVISIRRDLHRHPELAFEEHRTAGFVADYLKHLDIEVTRGVARTGVIGLLKGANPGKTLAIRCDMDALPQIEEREVPYKSLTPGIQHGCGHDAHVAMGLGAAKILSTMRNTLSGTVKFIFEPAEEKVTGDFRDPIGAQIMIEEGCLGNPKVDAVLFLHVNPDMPVGHIFIPSGIVCSGWDVYDIRIIGKEKHAAEVHEGVDAIAVAAMVINGIQSYMNRKVKIITPCTLHIGEIKGGRSRSIVADRVDMYGSLRCADVELRGRISTDLENMIKGISEAFGASYSIDHIPYLGPIVNEPHLTALVYAATEQVLGKENVHYSVEPRMTGDSFFHYSEKVPSVVAWVGTGNPEKDTSYPHHHPRFDIDEDGMKAGVLTILATALKYLEKS